jgi:hypothetical protein
VHIILALFIFGDNPTGIGRYRLKEDLLIGSGTSKSLITKLNEKINFISVLNGNIRKGHVLTKSGKEYLAKIKTKLPLIKEGNISILQDTIIHSEKANAYFCQVKNAANRLTNGIEQRDAAIKVGGLGATCIVFNGNHLVFPSGYVVAADKANMTVNENVHDYFKKEINSINSKLEKNDVIIIGLGENLNKARLAAASAALTLF